MVSSQALLPLGFQKLAVVETVMMHGTAGRRERFFYLKHLIPGFACHVKDSLRLHLDAGPYFEINKSCHLHKIGTLTGKINLKYLCALDPPIL